MAHTKGKWIAVEDENNDDFHIQVISTGERIVTVHSAEYDTGRAESDANRIVKMNDTFEELLGLSNEAYSFLTALPKEDDPTVEKELEDLIRKLGDVTTKAES